MTSPRHTPTTSAKNEIVVYQPNDVLRLDVQLEHDTVWLTILQMCQLFGRERSVIAKHLNAAIQEGELDAGINVQNLHKNQKGRPQALYDLDAIISVGYRVKSLRGTQFRRWATNVLRDHLLKRFSVNARLNQLEDKMDRRSRSSPVAAHTTVFSSSTRPSTMSARRLKTSARPSSRSRNSSRQRQASWRSFHDRSNFK